MSDFERYFPDWYRLTAIDPATVPIDARRTAIDAFGRDATAADLIDLALLANRQPCDDFPDRFRDVFRANDPTFRMLDNDLEMAVLAGATVVRMLETASPRADLVALAACSLNFCRRVSLPPSLPKLSADYLQRRSVEARERPDPASMPNATALQKVVGALNPTAEEAQSPASQADLVRVAKAAYAYANSITKSWEGMTGRLEALANARSEEVDVLWWLLGERSTSLERAWSSVPVLARPLVASSELASLTRLEGILPSGMAILERVVTVRKAAPAPIAQYISGTPLDWRKNHVSAAGELQRVLPIEACLDASFKASDSSVWPSLVATSIDASMEVDSVAIAWQHYAEDVLIRTYASLVE